jgi:thiol:disulfide interchange protein
MKYFLFISIITALLVSSFTREETNKTSTETDGIQFKDISFEEAIKEAKSSNKLIFIDAYAVWCGPCKWMAANTFTDKKVGTLFNDNFINLKIDMEKGEGPVLARKFKVTAYPTLFFINKDEEIVKRVIGAKPPQEFLTIGKSVLQ